MSKKFRPGALVQQSGIYRVNHDSHRLMHHSTLTQGELFPMCRQCKHRVRFELLHSQNEQQQVVGGHHAILEDFPRPELVLPDSN